MLFSCPPRPCLRSQGIGEARGGQTPRAQHTADQGRARGLNSTRLGRGLLGDFPARRGV